MSSAFSHIGELAALGTATCWCVSSIGFEEAGKRIGSLSVNLIRLLFAFVFLSLATWVIRGVPFPVDATGHAWLWLAISGVVGFAFGDLCLFRAFVVLGARLSMLCMSLVPPMTAVIGWLVLGETLAALDMFAIGLTVCGVGLAVSERRERRSEPPTPGARRTRGILLAFGGALGQAGGLVLSKYGMGTYNALAATHIRIMAGIGGFVVIFTAIRWWPRLWAARRSRSGLGFTALGALFGPVIGVSLSLLAVQYTATGVAASIMATAPILIIPIVAVVYKERVTARGVLGAVIALVGVILLFV